MKNVHNSYLIIGAVSTALAAIAHLTCLVLGGSWYRFLGAGEHIANMAESGHWYPSFMAITIATILLIWSAYALSGAGMVRRLPLLKLALCSISFIFIIRGLGFPLIMPLFPGNSVTFWVISSGICLFIGLIHLTGLRQVWSHL